MITLAAWTDLAAEHFVAFLVGIVIGFVLSNRYRLVKRKGNGHDDPR